MVICNGTKKDYYLYKKRNNERKYNYVRYGRISAPNPHFQIFKYMYHHIKIISSWKTENVYHNNLEISHLWHHQNELIPVIIQINENIDNVFFTHVQYIAFVSIEHKYHFYIHGCVHLIKHIIVKNGTLASMHLMFFQLKICQKIPMFYSKTYVNINFSLK